MVGTMDFDVALHSIGLEGNSMAEGSTADAVQKRRYGVFLIIEGVLLAAALVGCAAGASHLVGKWVVWPLIVLCIWHVCAFPICFLYFIGKPVAMTLAPLIPSAESRAYIRRLKERPTLSDKDFHARFYEDSGIPQHILARIRKSLRRIDSLYDRALPTDHLYLLDDDVDFADVLRVIEREFHIGLVQSARNEIDGTLDNLVRLVHVRLAARSG
jgi:hypothetical protein